MKVFITGVGGFLGHHIAVRMHELDFDVAGNDTFIGGEEDNVPSFVDFTLCDCCDFEAMKKAMKGCDLVYHCAATAHEGLSVFSPAFLGSSQQGLISFAIRQECVGGLAAALGITFRSR